MRGDPLGLVVAEHGHVCAQPADRVEDDRPQVGDRVLEAGVLREEGQHRRRQDDPGHCSPRIARRGSRRPAMLLTMSTVCRVSTTSWTR